MSSFSGLTAVVTGAGSGIGRALSYRLATEGAILAISDIDDLGLAETASHGTDLGARVRVDRLDVTDRDSVLAYADSVAGEFGAVHLVINNAGFAHCGDFLGMSFTGYRPRSRATAQSMRARIRSGTPNSSIRSGPGPVPNERHR